MGKIDQNNPNFSQADLEAVFVLEQASLQAKVKEQYQTNNYDGQTRSIKQELLAHSSRINSIPHNFQDNIPTHDVTFGYAWIAKGSSSK